MKNTFGNNITITLFGESHGPCIGAILDGMTPGIPVDEDFIKIKLAQRAPSTDISTPRKEKDSFQIISGVYEGKTTGTPIAIIIPNEDIDSSSYIKDKNIIRPGHADYTAECKYHGFQDSRGGGHFSGRLTAALVAAGAICIKALELKGIYIGTHILKCGEHSDREFSHDYKNNQILMNDIKYSNEHSFPVLDNKIEEKIISSISSIAKSGDSIGGILETAILGVPSGIGEPWFDTVEGMLSHAMFSIPAIKGISFGSGFDFSNLLGSEANDSPCIYEDKVTHKTNHNGGIIGGITDGMPLIFKCAVKPTPSIKKTQKTINLETMENTSLSINGRHDAAIIARIKEVINEMTAITICDLLCTHFGTDWLRS